MKTLIFLCLSLHASFSFASAAGCFGLMSSLQSVDGSVTYLNLIKYLVKEKNAISAHALREMAEQKSIPNTMDFISSSLTSEDRYAFKKAFGSIKNVNWESVREKLKSLAEDSKQDENQRQGARDSTRFIYAPVPIHSWFENREFGGKKLYDSPGGLAFIGYERNKGTYFFDLNTNQGRLVNVTFEQTTFVRLKNGLGVIAQKNKNGEILVEEALTGKPMAALNVTDLFPKFPIVNPQNISIRLYGRADGGLRIIGEDSISLPGRKGVYDFSSTGSHGFLVSEPMGSGTGIYALQDGSLIKHPLEWKEEIELKELSEVPPSKPLLNIKTPSELKSFSLKPWEKAKIKGRFQEMADGRSFYMAYNSKGFLIYDLKTLQKKIVKVDGSLISSQWGQVVNVNGELKIVEHVTKGNLLEVKIGEFSGKVQNIEFKNTRITSPVVLLHHHDGRDFGVLATSRADDGGALIKEIQFVELSTGLVHQIKFYGERFTRLLAVKEEGGRIVGFFLNTEQNIVPMQLYGPIPGETP